MIGRRTATVIAESYIEKFTYADRGPLGHRITRINYRKIYDFLFNHNFSAWFCNIFNACGGGGSFKDAIMKVHTGETLVSVTEDWSWDRREKYGQEYLEYLAEAFLQSWDEGEDQWGRKKLEPHRQRILGMLELDGYLFRDSRLIRPEEDVLDAREERGVLGTLFQELRLPNEGVAFHHLDLSEEHFLASRWDDSISNSRKFLECVLSEVVRAHSTLVKGAEASQRRLESPRDVRDYLEEEGLLDTKEKEALAKLYGLLSHTGGHPYMAQNDQARLLRHLSLTLSQFALLRLQGSLKDKS